jgi:uncharacterized protein YndB with AHSA1/START domain
VVTAGPHVVFAALLDQAALADWLPPDGMAARFEHFDPRPGGGYRLVLRYQDAAAAPGKSTADTDVVEVRYVDIERDARVVQAVDFVADDPAFAGTMIMSWTVRGAPDGTLVEIVATGVPEGISAEDHEAGMSSSLAHLAAYVESRNQQ